MPLYMDIHRNVQGLTGQKVAEAHQKDVEVQKKHGVRQLAYWYDTKSGTIFCLSEAPSADAAKAVHRDSHGMMPDEIVEVTKGV